MSANEQTVRRGYDAFGRGDLDELTATLSPDVVWHEPGRNVLSGEYRGIDAVLGFFGELVRLSEGTFRAELQTCGEIAPDLVACLVHVSATMPGGSLDHRLMQLCRVTDGRTAEVSSFSEDQHGMDEVTGMAQISLPEARTSSAPVTAG